MRARLGKAIQINLIAAAATLGIAPAFGQCDAQAPGLVSFDFDPKVADVTAASQPVVATFVVNDDLSGVERVTVNFEPPSASQRTRSCTASVPTAGTRLDGTFSCTVVFDGNPQQGTWQVDRVTAVDRVGRSTSLSTGELLAQGFPTALQMTSVEDITAPLLSDLSLSTSSVDVSSGDQPITCTITATDNLAGITGAGCLAESPTADHRAVCSSLTPVSGTPQNGVFECTMLVPQYAESGTWELSADLNDAEGNSIAYLSADLAGLAFPSQISVASTPEDLLPPTLNDFDLQPTSVNVEAGDGVATCTAGLSDNPAGVAGFTCSATFIDVNFEVLIETCASIEPTSGNSTHGTWSCDITIPQYAPGGSRDITATFFDVLGNADAADSVELAGAGYPSSLDVVCGTGSGGLSPNLNWVDKQLVKWNAVPGALLYEVYGDDLSTLADANQDGLPDAGYGVCRNGEDLNPTDTEFVDASDPAAGFGEFLLVGYRTILQTGLGLGQTSGDQDRTPGLPCP